MKKVFLKLVIVSFGLMSLISCKKEVIDPRDEIVGTYSGKQHELIIMQGITVHDTTYNASVSVSKNGDGLNFYENNHNKAYYSTRQLIQTQSGDAFVLQDETILVDSTNLTISGSRGYVSGLDKFDGVFLSNTKTLNYEYTGAFDYKGLKIILKESFDIYK